jgi:hypothetical protein
LERRHGVFAGRPANFADADAYAEQFNTAFGYYPLQMVQFSAGADKTIWKGHWTDVLSADRTTEVNNLFKAIDAGHTTGISVSLIPYIVEPGEPTARLDPVPSIVDWYNGNISTVTHNGTDYTLDEWADQLIQDRANRIADNPDDDLMDHFVDTLLAHGYAARPVDIRLFHEMNFPKRPHCSISPPGRRGLVEASFVDLWRYHVGYIRTRVRAALGFWPAKWKFVFNPASAGNAVDSLPFNGLDDWFETFYPGDSWVDVVSFNMYPDPANPERSARHMRDLIRFAERHNKPAQINEFGTRGSVYGDDAARCSQPIN